MKMSSATTRNNFLIFLHKIAKIKTIPEFCKVFDTNISEINYFLNDSELIIPIHWLDVLWKKPLTTEEEDEFVKLHTHLFPTKLKDPIWYDKGDSININSPNYDHLANISAVRQPRSNKKSTVKPSKQLIVTPVQKKEFPTPERLRKIITTALTCSAKDSGYNSLALKENLHSLIPDIEIIKVSDTEIVFSDLESKVEVTFVFEQKIKFL